MYLRRSAWLIAISLVAIAAAAPIGLSWFGKCLTVTEAGTDFRYIHIVSGDRSMDVAAEESEQHAASILLIPTHQNRIVELGVWPDPMEMTRNALAERDVVASQIVEVDRVVTSDRERLETLGKLLDDDPDARLLFLCNELHGARWSYLRNQCLSEDLAARVTLRGLQDRRFSASNWWQSCAGLKAWFAATVSLVCTRAYGEATGHRDRWDADKYEAALQKRLAVRQH